MTSFGWIAIDDGGARCTLKLAQVRSQPPRFESADVLGEIANTKLRFEAMRHENQKPARAAARQMAVCLMPPSLDLSDCSSPKEDSKVQGYRMDSTKTAKPPIKRHIRRKQGRPSYISRLSNDPLNMGTNVSDVAKAVLSEFVRLESHCEPGPFADLYRVYVRRWVIKSGQARDGSKVTETRDGQLDMTEGQFRYHVKKIRASRLVSNVNAGLAEGIGRSSALDSDKSVVIENDVYTHTGQLGEQVIGKAPGYLVSIDSCSACPIWLSPIPGRSKA